MRTAPNLLAKKLTIVRFGSLIGSLPANPFGLIAAVFTNDPKKAFDVARKIRAGTVGHHGPRTDFSIGFGGFPAIRRWPRRWC
ncbi:aldehyde dehydrogenase family protein [[Pseudomonas] hibiscicola]|uniref:Aldehyde dehydrogenase family protein n=1 Tax=Stenotrophomonas hibiscicola TaxID=86189 RepID=A0ABV0C6Z5_9GAMM